MQTAKQIIIQKVKDAERDKIFDEYKDKKSQIVSGFVQRFEGGSIIVNLGRTEGILPRSEQVQEEGYRIGGVTKPQRFIAGGKVARDPADNDALLRSLTSP